MAKRVFALLVGINDYAPHVGPLRGCLSDVDRFYGYLVGRGSAQPEDVKVLKDGDATRGGIIDGFRSHLGQAGADDAAVFQFCGHGARSASNVAFHAAFPDGRDEGLVCYDSRVEGGHDLADKELSVLISELAAKGVHVTVLLDSCHSGSGTRGVDDAVRGLTPRLTDEVTTPRDLHTYLDGHYAALLDANPQASLIIPEASHILLAACDRYQLAQESATQGGVFTNTLIDVLEKSGGALSYADLFVCCRAAVRSHASNQDPQFESYDQFDASSGFLGSAASHTAPRQARYEAFHNGDDWVVACGAVHGVPVDPGTPAAFAIFRQGDLTTRVGTAKAVKVGAQQSQIQPDPLATFASDQNVRYIATITSLPAAPMAVAFTGAEEARAGVQKALDDACLPIGLVGTHQGAGYGLAAEGSRLVFSQVGHRPEIGFADVTAGEYGPATLALQPALAHIVEWERSVALQNRHTAMDPSKVDFEFSEQLAGGERVHPGTETTLDFTQIGEEWQDLRGRLKVRNQTGQKVYVTLVYFGEDNVVKPWPGEPVESGNDYKTLWGDAEQDTLFLPDGVDSSAERFKLLVTTEPLDGFLLEQKELERGLRYAPSRAIGSIREQRKRTHSNAWFTKDFTIRLVRRRARVSPGEDTIVSAGAGAIVVKKNGRVKANIRLSPARSTTRDAGASAEFITALEKRGLSLYDFSGGTRGGGELGALEFTNLENASELGTDPLEIELDIPLKDGEGLLPIVYDGEHVLLGGASWADDGKTHVVINHVPETAEQQRSLTGSLKLYFFKTYLKRENLNRLRWAEYGPNGSVEQGTEGLKEKVAAARRVLLLVHGITGDTEPLVQGVQESGLKQQFDLVLTYDYENLATPIADTARLLEGQLREVGLHERDDKHLTLLAHSMGGLVSRWFIEREKGRQMVDHLVMCGTPNGGSPFGYIEQARAMFKVTTTLAMNLFPGMLPINGMVLGVLNAVAERSKKLTPTLEQMKPGSEFIRELNESDDPGIPYTILAGDLANYSDASDADFKRLLTKAGGAVLKPVFKNKPHDIAVSVDSILSVEGSRSIAPVHIDVPCHHLNYFVSSIGQKALMDVQW